MVYSILNDSSLSVNVVNELSQNLSELNSRQVAQQDLHQIYQTYLDNLFNDLLHAKTNLNTENLTSTGAVTPDQVGNTTSSELEPFFHALELTIDDVDEIVYAKLNPFELCHDVPGLLPVLEEQGECNLQLIFNDNQEDITVNLTPRKIHYDPEEDIKKIGLNISHRNHRSSPEFSLNYGSTKYNELGVYVNSIYDSMTNMKSSPLKNLINFSSA